MFGVPACTVLYISPRGWWMNSLCGLALEMPWSACICRLYVLKSHWPHHAVLCTKLLRMNYQYCKNTCCLISFEFSSFSQCPFLFAPFLAQRASQKHSHFASMLFTIHKFGENTFKYLICSLRMLFDWCERFQSLELSANLVTMQLPNLLWDCRADSITSFA